MERLDTRRQAESQQPKREGWNTARTGSPESVKKVRK